MSDFSPPESAPKRIQLRRVKGWRKPEGAVVVARPSRWGNFYRVRRNRISTGYGTYKATGTEWVVVATHRGHETGEQWAGFTDEADATAFAVGLFRRALLAVFCDLDGGRHRDYYLAGLAGHDLACWCALDASCHADVLLEFANTVSATKAGEP